MKKQLTLIIATAALAVSTATAQDFGVRAGANIAKWVGDANEHVDQRTCFNVAIIADLNFHKDFYFRPGVMYNQKGGRYWNDVYTEFGVHEGHDFFYNQNYLEFPLCVAYKRKMSQNVSIDFQTGAYIAFGIHGKTKVEYKKSPEHNFEYDMFRKCGEEMIGTQAKRFDFGWNLALGVNFKKYYLGVGYDIGLMPIHDCHEFMIIDHWKPHNSCVMINLGYYFLSL